jgi:hypothetical protein
MATVPQGVGSHLAFLANGVQLDDTCRGAPFNDVVVEVFPSSGSNLQVSGTANQGGTTSPVDGDGVTFAGAVDPSDADLDVLARDISTGGTFDRIDFHGDFGISCTFWAMVTPSR